MTLKVAKHIWKPVLSWESFPSHLLSSTSHGKRLILNIMDWDRVVPGLSRLFLRETRQQRNWTYGTVPLVSFENWLTVFVENPLSQYTFNLITQLRFPQSRKNFFFKKSTKSTKDHDKFPGNVFCSHRNSQLYKRLLCVMPSVSRAARLYRYSFSQIPSLLFSGSGSRPQREELPLTHLVCHRKHKKFLARALCSREKFWARLVGKSRAGGAVFLKIIISLNFI